MRRIAIGLLLSLLAARAPAATGAQATGERETPERAPRPAADWSRGLSFRSADGRFTLDLSNRIQVRYTHELPEVGDRVGSFRIRRARTTLSGKAYSPELGYRLQIDWPSSSLLDAELTWSLSPAANLWTGQGKAWFGRQQLTSTGNLQFVDRTILDGRFNPGRQIGAGFFGAGADKKLEYQVGIYNGNGINPSRNDNDSFLTVGRLVWNPLGEYRLEESAHDYPGSPRLAIGVAGMSTTTGTGASEVDITRLGAEVAFKIKGLSLVGEYVTEEAEPRGGAAVDTDGYYLQVGYLFPNRKLELAGRWAVIRPDTPTHSDRTETGAAASWYLARHGYKLQSDFRRLENKETGRGDDEVRLQVQVSF
jgi:phosphate-selective porin OprO and OprP